MDRRVFNILYCLSAARIFGIRFPLLVGWSITNRCNSECLYCTSWRDKKDELNTEQLFSIIDELADMGTQSISYTGGEPLIREDIGRIVRYTKNKGIKTGISSNGLLVGVKIDDIKGIDSLVLSFDGEEEIHDMQRCSGSYRKVLEAIRLAKENDIPIRLHTVLTKNNIDSVDYILDFAKREKLIVSFTVVEFDPFSEKEEILKLLPQKERFREVISRLISEKKAGNKYLGNSTVGLEYFLSWPYCKRMLCSAGRIYCRIESNGDVFPCANLVNETVPQNCIRDGFRNAFKRLSWKNCDICWCDTRIEMNYIYSFNLEAIYNAKSIFR